MSRLACASTIVAKGDSSYAGKPSPSIVGAYALETHLSRATSGNHVSVWKTLPALKLLLDRMEQMKVRLEDFTSSLVMSVNSNLTDRSYTIYAMAP